MSSNAYQKALEEGASPEEIHQYFVNKIPNFEQNFQKSLSEGASPEEIYNYVAEKKSSQKPKEVAKKKIRDKPIETDEDLERDIERNQAQITSRLLERAVGFPGDLAHSIPEGLRKFIPGSQILEKLPTSEKLQKLSEKASGGFLAPQSEFEKRVGEYAGDVGSFLFGGEGKTFATTLGKIFGIPLLGQTAKEAIKVSGGSEKAQDWAKIGTMFITSLISGTKGGARAYGNDKLDAAEKAIPKNAKADIHVLSTKLDKIKKDLKSGVTGPHSSDALKAIEEIKDHMYDGLMSADKFPIIRKDLNKIIDSKKGFALGKEERAIRRAAVNNLNKVKSAVIQAGNRWGRKNSPEFFKDWREGNEALAVYHNSQRLGNFFADKTKIKNQTLRYILGAHSIHHPVAAAGIYGARKAVGTTVKVPTEIIYRFFASPVLRKLYMDALKAAAKENASAAASAIAKMEKEMDREGIK